MTLRLTTELDAVNIMLGTIGESPINSLDAASGVSDAVTARGILSEVAVQVLEHGWHFNTNNEVVLTPTSTKEILLPPNILEMDASPYEDLDVVQRGGKVYNKATNSFLFDKSFKADLTLLIEFEEMPQAARHYITVRAARVFQQRVVGSDTLAKFTEKDETRALMAMKRYEARTADYNILSGNYAVMRVLQR